MPNEELVQRRYYDADGLHGDIFGIFEEFNLGSTNLAELVRAGLIAVLPDAVTFPFKEFKPPKVRNAKPDRLYGRRDVAGLHPVAIIEQKQAAQISTDSKRLQAGEQALFYGLALGLGVAGYTAGSDYWYVDVPASAAAGELVYLHENRTWNPGVLSNLLAGDAEIAKDPTPLAESVWQTIWHATKAGPEACLLTFVEIFVLKFLSDNLPTKVLAEKFRFYGLLGDDREFLNQNGKLQIEYYVSTIRPKIKELFPDTVVASDALLGPIFGLETIVSKTSVINGFAFLHSSDVGLSSFNRTFCDILHTFDDYGPLTTIDPEFKLRLYETFLKRSARQQRLGQFFTPRNIVQPMISMAELSKLPDGALMLDPAAGVGGFILEPLLPDGPLAGNVTFKAGSASRRILAVGADVDSDVHILAKANMLLHLAEAVRDPATTTTALNKAMANTFILMNEHLTLGSLLYPPQGVADVILTNPPYVTQGSAVYREAVADVEGPRNGVDLKDYYDTGGLGVESLFLRYISGALKPGGHAFVIVPLGLLNRTEPRPKRALLAECNLIASISLPRKAFFNTAQPTYILGLERRHTDLDERPDVFCAIARTTGETLDHRRTPTPKEYDLARIAEAFVAWRNGDHEPVDASPIMKIMPHEEFGADNRWDVPRFWTDEELVAIGRRPAPMTRSEFLDEATNAVDLLVQDLRDANAELDMLAPEQTRSLSLADADTFWIRPGKRITHDQLLAHPGELPVYSCFTKAHMEKGRVSEDWVVSQGIPIIEEPCVTVNATGASGVGIVFVRDHRCVLTDDVIAISPKNDRVDLYYLAAALRSSVTGGDFQYEAKLYQGRVRELTVEFPITAGGELDLELQTRIGSAVRRVEALQERLSELGVWSRSARLT